MKKIGNKIYLTEEEASPSYQSPDCVRVTDMPLCGVCQNWNGYGKCKKLGKSPDAYREAERQDCPEAVLDTGLPAYSKFVELYPEAATKLLERQERNQAD